MIDAPASGRTGNVVVRAVNGRIPRRPVLVLSMSTAGGKSGRGCLIAAGVVIAITFVGFWALIVWSLLDERDERASDTAAAAADPRFKRPLVSSTGRLAFVVQHRGETVHVVNVSGTQLTQVSRVPKGSYVTGPLWSPDGTRLTFASDGTVHTVHTVGDASTWRTSIDRDAFLPIWSPDGRRAVFLTEGKGHTWNLLVSDGSTRVDITRGWPAAGYGRSHSVVWSADSRRFAFARTKVIARRRPGNIYLVNADGSDLTRVTHYPDEGDWTKVEDLAWSADEQRFAYSNGGAVVTIAADGSDRAEFGHRLKNMQQFPAWSPDSRRIAWANDHSIVVSGPRGEEPRELTRGRAAGTSPVWSPDGSRIAFVDLWNARLYVMNSDGSGLTLLAEMPEDRLHPPTLHRPAWQPQTP